MWETLTEFWVLGFDWSQCRHLRNEHGIGAFSASQISFEITTRKLEGMNGRMRYSTTKQAENPVKCLLES